MTNGCLVRRQRAHNYREHSFDPQEQPADRRLHRIIGINDGHSATRQRFSIAHEIGHALLHLPAEPPASGDAVVDKPIEVLFRDGIAAMGVDKREIEANAFAAELLMPAKALRERFRELIRASGSKSTDALVRELAAIYEVSTQAMGYRLANLNLIDPA